MKPSEKSTDASFVLSTAKYAHAGNIVSPFKDSSVSPNGDWKVVTAMEIDDNGRAVASDLLHTPCGKIVDLHQLLVEHGYPHIGAKPMPYRIEACDTTIEVRLVGHHPAMWSIRIEPVGT